MSATCPGTGEPCLQEQEWGHPCDREEDGRYECLRDPDRNRRQALAALFDAGVNFADYDEGKGSARPPEGYDHRNVSIAEVRRRAVERALAALNEADG